MTTTTTTTTTTMTPTSITAALARSTLRSFDCIVCECTDESLEGLCAHMLNQHSLVIRNIGLIHENAREYVVRDTRTRCLISRCIIRGYLRGYTQVLASLACVSRH